MARVVGVFENGNTLPDVVAQLRLNGVNQVVTIEPAGNLEQAAQQIQGMGAPEAQAVEYRKRLNDQRWLLFVQVGDLELPMAQRALRNAGALDVDILPDSTAV